MNYTLCFESDERAVTFGFKAYDMEEFLGALPDFLKAVGFALEPNDGVFMLSEEDLQKIAKTHDEIYNKIGT
jgi:hypothetical protein